MAEEYCDAYEKKGSQPCHMVVYRAMLNCRGLLYAEDGVPFVMSGQAIFNWLKRRWATQKAAGINLATAMAASPAITLEREEGGEEEEVVDDAEDDDVDYRGMTVPALRSLLKAKDLPSSGKKEELVQRLIEENDDTEDEKDDGKL